MAWLTGVAVMRQFTKPMGLAVGPRKLALATRDEITLFASAPLLAADLLPDQRGKYDALYLPRATYHTGDVNVHDIAFADDGLWFVNSRFSCLSATEQRLFICAALEACVCERAGSRGRCHLNGLAIVDGKPKYATALAKPIALVAGDRTRRERWGVDRCAVGQRCTARAFHAAFAALASGTIVAVEFRSWRIAML